MNDDGPEWFAPKRYGYGSSLPIAWQGWAILFCYIILITAAAWAIRLSWIAYVSILIPITLLFIFICARTTRGGWRWRWGDDDED